MVFAGHCHADTAAKVVVGVDRTAVFVAVVQWVKWERTNFGSDDC